MDKIKQHFHNIKILTKLFFIPHKNSAVSTIFNSVGIPVCMMFFLTLVTGYSEDYFLRIVAGSVMMGMITMSISTVAVKINNLVIGDGLEFFLAYSISKGEFVAGILSSLATIYLSSNIFILFIGMLLAKIEASILMIIAIYIMVFLLVTIAMLPIGVIIGFKCSNYNSTISISNIISYVLIFFSPIYYDIQILPLGLQKLMGLLPTSFASTMINNSFVGVFSFNHAMGGMLICLVWMIVGFGMVKRTLKWAL